MSVEPADTFTSGRHQGTQFGSPTWRPEWTVATRQILTEERGIVGEMFLRMLG